MEGMPCRDLLMQPEQEDRLLRLEKIELKDPKRILQVSYIDTWNSLKSGVGEWSGKSMISVLNLI